ncbi:MAG TPA: hypothetical protein PLV45_14310 [bacterium]|nr:hypothetical protein [bacterium]
MQINGDAMVTVESYRDPYEAHLAAGYLEAGGVFAEVVDENMVTADWLLSQGIGGVKLRVRGVDALRATDLLRDMRCRDSDGDCSTAAVKEGDCCPACGSTAIFPRSYSPWSLLLMAVLLIPVFIPRKKWRCFDCGYTWR